MKNLCYLFLALFIFSCSKESKQVNPTTGIHDELELLPFDYTSKSFDCVTSTGLWNVGFEYNPVTDKFDAFGLDCECKPFTNTEGCVCSTDCTEVNINCHNDCDSTLSTALSTDPSNFLSAVEFAICSASCASSFSFCLDSCNFEQVAQPMFWSISVSLQIWDADQAGVGSPDHWTTLQGDFLPGLIDDCGAWDYNESGQHWEENDYWQQGVTFRPNFSIGFDDEDQDYDPSYCYSFTAVYYYFVEEGTGDWKDCWDRCIVQGTCCVDRDE